MNNDSSNENIEFDLEPLLAAKREELESKLREQEEAHEKRRQRFTERLHGGAKSYEIELRRRAAEISECLAEYSPVALLDWFRLDNWTVQEGLILLCGFSPDGVPFKENGELSIPIYFGKEFSQDYYLGHDDYASLIWGDKARERRKLGYITRLDGLRPYDLMTIQILGEDRITRLLLRFKLAYDKRLTVWNSGSHSELRYPPKYFVDWAVNKGFNIPWLDWVKAQGYYGELSKNAEDSVRPEDGSKVLSAKSEAANLNIIGALLELYWQAAHPGEEYSQSVVLAQLKKYEGFAGMSERNLKDKLTRAVRAISSS